MGMTIEEIIQGIEVIKAQAEWDYPLDWQIVLDRAIDTMRKYQKLEQEPILDKISAEIEELPIAFTSSFEMKQDCLEILDKYKAEVEPQESEDKE